MALASEEEAEGEIVKPQRTHGQVQKDRLGRFSNCLAYLAGDLLGWKPVTHSPGNFA